MTASREIRPATPALGPLLVGLLQAFHADLLAHAAEHGFADVRQAHLQVFAALEPEGLRLTELARRCGLSLAATSELVNDLQAKGYLQRRPDPADGRARIIEPTTRGHEAMALGTRRIPEIEQAWAHLLGEDLFEVTKQGLTELYAAVTTRPTS